MADENNAQNPVDGGFEDEANQKAREQREQQAASKEAAEEAAKKKAAAEAAAKDAANKKDAAGDNKSAAEPNKGQEATGGQKSEQTQSAGDNKAAGAGKEAAKAEEKIKAPTIKEYTDGGKKIVLNEDGFHPKMEEAKKKLAEAKDDAAKAEAKKGIDRLNNELKDEAHKAIKGMKEEDLSKVKGYMKDAHPDALKALGKEAAAHKMFGIARSESLGAALSHNLGKEAWNTSKPKLALKAGGTAVGLGMVYDGAFNSERDGPDGKPEGRSWVVRLGEVGAGGLLAAVSALGGRRI